MSKTYNGNLNVIMGISVGNWVWGRVTTEMDPEAPVSIDVTGVNVMGEGYLNYQVSARTRFPWFSTSQPTVSSLEEEGGSQSLAGEEDASFRIWLRRKNKAVTSVDWMLWRDAV